MTVKNYRQALKGVLHPDLHMVQCSDAKELPCLASHQLWAIPNGSATVKLGDCDIMWEILSDHRGIVQWIIFAPRQVFTACPNTICVHFESTCDKIICVHPITASLKWHRLRVAFVLAEIKGIYSIFTFIWGTELWTVVSCMLSQSQYTFLMLKP